MCYLFSEYALCKPQRNIGSTKVRLPLMRIGTAEIVDTVGNVAYGGMRRKFRIEFLHTHTHTHTHTCSMLLRFVPLNHTHSF